MREIRDPVWLVLVGTLCLPGVAVADTVLLDEILDDDWTDSTDDDGCGCAAGPGSRGPLGVILLGLLTWVRRKAG